MCFALLLSLTGKAFIISEVVNGGGRHVGDVALKTYQIGLEIIILSQPMYAVAVCVVKESVGAALIRIAGPAQKTHMKIYRGVVITIMTIMGCWAFASIFVS